MNLNERICGSSEDLSNYGDTRFSDIIRKILQAQKDLAALNARSNK